MPISTAAAVAFEESSRHHTGSMPVADRRRIFGLTIASNFPFNLPLPPGDGPADLSLTVSLSSLSTWKRLTSPPIYTSALRNESGESLALLYRDSPEGEVLRFSDAGDFHIRLNGIDYVRSGDDGLAELRFLGPVLSYWLELRGLPTFHASAVSVNGRAAAFATHHGGGKSGLAAAMIQAGSSLLTDDLLVLEEQEDRWEVRPSYPEMRMWPDEASHFAGPPEDLPLVQTDSEKRRVAIGDGGFGSFQDTSAPLSCIYLASRRKETDGGIEIQPVSRSEALIELVRHSFSPRLVEAAGLQPARLDRLARLVRSVPVRRLVYPSGFERLPEVVEIVLGSC
jgi:hypothetical protein